MSKPQMSSTRTFQSTTEIETSANNALPSTGPNFKISKKYVPWIIVILLLIFSIFLYAQYLSAKDTINGPGKATVSKQVQSTISEVSRLAVVPSNETPTVATVQNADKLKSQLFFADAQNGDKVIVYAKADKAILYRPSTNQIVNISAVSVSK